MGGEIDAAIVACAGLNRLGLTERISAVLSLEDFVPAPAQGALAVQIRADDGELAELVRRLDDGPSRVAVEVERTVLAAMQGGCSIPLGVYARISGDSITIDAMISDPEGKRYIKRSQVGDVSRPKSSAERFAVELLSSGGREILEQIRDERKDRGR
jgi:hydroxymethylbilane synthase